MLLQKEHRDTRCLAVETQRRLKELLNSHQMFLSCLEVRLGLQWPRYRPEGAFGLEVTVRPRAALVTMTAQVPTGSICWDLLASMAD